MFWGKTKYVFVNYLELNMLGKQNYTQTHTQFQHLHALYLRLKKHFLLSGN